LTMAATRATAITAPLPRGHLLPMLCLPPGVRRGQQADAIHHKSCSGLVTVTHRIRTAFHFFVIAPIALNWKLTPRWSPHIAKSPKGGRFTQLACVYSVHPERVKLGVTRDSTDGYELQRPTSRRRADFRPPSQLLRLANGPFGGGSLAAPSTNVATRIHQPDRIRRPAPTGRDSPPQRDARSAAVATTEAT
jgi:hypothetical protein